MKVSALKLASNVIILFALSTICFGQEINFEESNWFKEIMGIDDFYTRFDFKSYTKEDVIKAKKKFNLVKESPIKNEWEGTYTRGTELGESALHWSSESGFVIYYVYHTLGSLDYGSTFDKADSVKLTSEKSSNKSYFSTNLVKIKFGDKHYLVPENRVQDFAARAAGLATDITDSNYYLWKSEESKSKIFGFPILPEKYKKFLRFPIETKIIKSGKRELHQDRFDDKTINYEEIYRYVTIGAGKNKNIKVGMNFFIEDLGEWAEITKVSAKSSIAKIRRGLDENHKEECFDEEHGQGQVISCREIKLGMTVKTKVSDSFF